MFAKRPVPTPEPQQFSDSLMTARAYDPNSHVFLCDDKHLFFGFLCMTLSGLDNGLDDRLNGLLNQDWPDDALMQCGLVLSPDLMQTIEQLLALQGHVDSAFAAMLDQNIRQLQAGVHQPMTNDQKLRRGILWMTLKVPLRQRSPSDEEMLRVKRLRQTFAGGIETAGLASVPMSQNDWLRLSMILVNHPEQGRWALSQIAAEPEHALNEQVFDPDTPLEVHPDHLVLGTGQKKRFVKVLVAKQLPPFAALGLAFNYMGDSQNGHRGIKCYAQIHVLLHFPPVRQLQTSLNNRQRIAIQQASSPITRFEPRLMERKKDFDLLFGALNQGDAPLKLTFTLVLYCDSQKEADMLSSNASSYYRELGFMLYDYPPYRL